MMSLQPKLFECQYCKSKFVKESTLMVHVCESKRRALAQKEKHVVIGFETYNVFFQKTQNFRGVKTYENFCKSPYYNAFVKFGSFVSNVKPLYPSKFIEYVVTSGTKLDHWCRDDLYDKYVLDLIKSESVETALERSITHMLDWGDTNNAQWNHYFSYVSLNRAMYDIKDGKVSPWLVLNSNSGKLMIKRFNDEQLAAVSSVLDIPFWFNKFKHRADDVELVKTVVKESNL
jgi:hypothetical protein